MKRWQISECSKLSESVSEHRNKDVGVDTYTALREVNNRTRRVDTHTALREVNNRTRRDIDFSCNARTPPARGVCYLHHRLSASAFASLH